MTRVVALVQARMGSTRFPGKMLASLGGRPLLEWVLLRVRAARRLDAVVLATSDRGSDDPLAVLAERLGVTVFRGDEDDVLGRFAAAANVHAADLVVRVCADNPFIDPGEIDRLVAAFEAESCDYACNHQDRLGSRYADGFGAEILANELLQDLAARASSPTQREHATLYLWQHAPEYRLHAVAAPPELAWPGLRFDVDLPADLDELQALVEAGVGVASSAGDIVRVARSTWHCLHDAAAFARTTAEMDRYLHRLFPLCRSLSGEPNRETLRILQEIVPLEIYEVPSGTPVYDWVVPDEWTVRDAWIADAEGHRLVDFQASNLHLVSYSIPVCATLSWTELAPHIHRHPTLPDAIPYRTSYYKRDWGFCVTHDQYAMLAASDGPLTVVVDADLQPGAMSYGEYLLPGHSSREVLISCYICHPSMANDSLSGVVLTAFLARHLAALPDRHWSYRIVFVPETIGAVAYCARNEAAMRQIDLGLVITTVGGPGGLGYKQSFESGHPLNGLIESVLGELAPDFVTYPFDIHGSDERQYSSQGFRINVATICRDRYYEYPYYHTSRDDLSFVTARQIAETLNAYVQLLARIEKRRIYRNRMPHCEVMLSRHDLYPATGGALQPEANGKSELDLILWLLFLSDGRMDIQHIAARLGVTVPTLERVADGLVAKGVLEAV